MRTTIDIHDELLAQAKQRAMESDRKIGEVVNDALREAFARRDVPSPRVELPTYGQGGARSGVDLDDSASLNDLLDGLTDDGRASV